MTKTVRSFAAIAAASIALLASIGTRAQPDSARAAARLGGSISLEAGQIVAGHYVQEPVDHRFIERLSTDVSVDAAPRAWLSVHVGLHGDLWYPFRMTRGTDWDPTEQTYFTPLINRAEGVFHFGNTAVRMDAGIGCFTFKYNPDARNLGEYLFRSVAYPAYIATDFDRPYARLAGCHIDAEFTNGIRQDLLITSATDRFPLYDWSLTCLLDVPAAGLLDAGAGIHFDHLLSVNDSLTDPRVVNGTDTVGSTFRSIKGMVRISIDPKVLLRTTIFGKSDLRVYGEMAVLGVLDQGPFSDIRQRVPIMVGCNLPAFGFLDVAAMEAEWWGSRYPNSLDSLARVNLPLPAARPDASRFAKDDWKWSVYATKSIGGLALTGQIANDHMLTRNALMRDVDYEQALTTSKDWYYMLKVGYSF
jgi:hypothetical protein